MLRAPERRGHPPRGRVDDVGEVELACEHLRLEPVTLGAEAVELLTRLDLRFQPSLRLELECRPRFVRSVDLAPRLELRGGARVVHRLDSPLGLVFDGGAGAPLAGRGGDPAPERREEPCGQRVPLRGHEEVQEIGIHVAADREDSETVPMREGEARVRARELVPEAPDGEVALADVRVVEQDDPSLTELRQPRLEVVGDRLIGVAPIEVEQIDRAVGEVGRRLVERLLEEAREAAVERIVVDAQVLEDLRRVRARVLVAFPGVDGVAAGLQAERLHGLAKGAVRIAFPGSELDEEPRPQRSDGEEGKGNVFVPAVDVGQPPRLLEHERVGQRLKRFAGSCHADR